MDSTNKEAIIDVIENMQHCASRFISNQKDLNARMLEISVSEGMTLLESLKDNIHEMDDDELKDAYLLNIIVPLQLVELINLRNQKEK